MRIRLNHKPGRTTSLALALVGTALAGGGLAFMALPAPAIGESKPGLPEAPASGELGFVVDKFVMPIIPGLEPCPEGLALNMREAYIESLDPAERARLTAKENEEELTRRWQSRAMGPNGTNVCSNPDMFERPLLRTVQHPLAWGMDLDSGGNEDTCAHEEFTDPHGKTGIDNQIYRALGCQPGIRGRDGMGGEHGPGTQQFFASGEWTQVLLLKGVDSLRNDPEVTVIYANTADRPVTDNNGRFLRGISYSVSTEAPRNRNVLKGRIVDGVLETEPTDIVLTQTWGQGGARDIRGHRTKYTFKKGRLRLAFQSDGSLTGMLGGYRPIFEEIQSPALGGTGSAVVAAIDCASNLATLRKMADGIRDPRTGQCTAASSAMQVNAIPAFVSDAPAGRMEAAR